VSLNRFCGDLLQQGLRNPAPQAPWRREAKGALADLKMKFGSNLLALAAFGSQVQGTADAHSDLDLLVVLKPSVPIVRSLYRWWEETGQRGEMEVNPHFVHLPIREKEASGLLFEISLQSEIIYERKKVLSRFLAKLKELIDSGVIVRQFSNGHPYWVWELKEAS
jgi:predicted nucleotidyltransferase